MIPQYNDDEEIYYASKTDEQPPSETYNFGERRCGWVKLIRDIVKFFHSVWVDSIHWILVCSLPASSAGNKWSDGEYYL